MNQGIEEIDKMGKIFNCGVENEIFNFGNITFYRTFWGRMGNIEFK